MIWNRGTIYLKGLRVPVLYFLDRRHIIESIRQISKLLYSMGKPDGKFFGKELRGAEESSWRYNFSYSFISFPCSKSYRSRVSLRIVPSAADLLLWPGNQSSALWYPSTSLTSSMTFCSLRPQGLCTVIVSNASRVLFIFDYDC